MIAWPFDLSVDAGLVALSLHRPPCRVARAGDARRAHVDPGTLSDLLGRRRRATLGTMRAICSSLNLMLVHMITFQTDVE